MNSAVSKPAAPAWATSQDGTRIAVHRLGGDGRPLIISHATGFHGRTYLPLVPVLGRSFSVWAVDLRGHGQSQLDADAEFTWTDLAADLAAAVELVSAAHDGELPVGVGHSMGGAAILMAETARPGTFGSAWLYEPIIFPAEIGPRNGFMADNARRRRAEFGSRAEALARYAGRPPLGLLRADALWAYVEAGFIDQPDGTVHLACRPEHEAMVFEGAVVPVTEVAGVNLPLLVAQGYVLDDMPSAAEFAAGTAEAIASATLRLYPDLGHFGPLEAPDRVATDIATWFSPIL